MTATDDLLKTDELIIDRRGAIDELNLFVSERDECLMYWALAIAEAYSAE